MAKILNAVKSALTIRRDVGGSSELYWAVYHRTRIGADDAGRRAPARGIPGEGHATLRARRAACS